MSVAPRVLLLLQACLLLFLQARGSPSQLADSDLQRLQGHWEGNGAAGECSITIKGNSLRFYAREDFWYETTIELPAGKDPRQLHATIRDSSPPKDAIGTVVFAIYQVEDDELLLAVDDGSGEAPSSFSEASSRYHLRRILPGG